MKSDSPKPDETYIEYFVRKAAYETLKTWCVIIATPILREPYVDKK